MPPQPAGSADIQLILGLARTHIDAQADQRIRQLLARSPDWAQLTSVAQRLEVMPLVWHNLVESYASLIPEFQLAALRSYLKQFRLFSTTRWLLLQDLLDSLQQRDIACLPIKGPTLAALAYGDPALRTLSDFDLLVERSALPAARELLMARGFQRLYDPDHEPAILREGNTFNFSNGHVTIELHGSLLSRGSWFRIAPEYEVFTRRRTLEWQGSRRIPVPAFEDYLLFLCAHGAKHRWTSLRWICDVAELASRGTEGDWERTLVLAQRTDNIRVLRLGLRLAHDLLSARIPEPVLRSVRNDAVTARLSRRIGARLFSPTPRSEGSLSHYHARAAQIGFRFSLLPGTASRVRFSAQILRRLWALGPSDYSVVPLPRALYPLYFLIRPMRLVGIAARMLYHLCGNTVRRADPTSHLRHSPF